MTTPVSIISPGSHGNAQLTHHAYRLRTLPSLWPHGEAFDCNGLDSLKLELRVHSVTYLQGGSQVPDPWSRLDVRVEHGESPDADAAWRVLHHFELKEPGIHQAEVKETARYLRARWCITRPKDDSGRQVFTSKVEASWSLNGLPV